MKDIETRSPINKQAAMMLSKAPWWAYPPPEVKKEIVEVAERISVENLVSVTKPPPENVIDRRGLTLFWANERKGLVVGYCHRESENMFRSQRSLILRSKYTGDNFNQSKIGREQRALHVWWVFSNGEFYPTKWKAPSSRNWRTQDEMDRGNMPRKMKWEENA